MGPGLTLSATKNYYTTPGWEPPHPNRSSRFLQNWAVNSAVSMATGDASPGQKGRGLPRSGCFPQKALRRRELCFPPAPGTRGCGLGALRPDARPSQPTTKTRDTKLGVRRPATGLGPAAGWATSGRTALTGSRTPQVYSDVGLDDGFRSSQPQAVPGPLRHKPGAAWS